MNERYTYGYNIGWDVENEYINSLNEIMADYNAQMNEVTKIANDITEIESRIEKNNAISDEQIRAWYNEDYALNGNLRSFESYKSDILNTFQETENQLRQTMLIKENEYFANLRYLSDVRFDTKSGLVRKENELKDLLEEKRLEWQVLNFRMHRDPSGIIPEDMRKQADDLFLDIRKLEHALEKLQELLNLIEPTQIEINFGMRALNLTQKDIYNKIKKGKEPSLDPNPTPDPIPDPIPNPIPNPTPQDDDLLELIDAYNKMLAEYKMLFEIYEQVFEIFGEYQQKYEAGEISYAEYEEYAKYMANRDEYLAEKYAEINAMYNNIISKDKTGELKSKIEAPQKPWRSGVLTEKDRENGQEKLSRGVREILSDIGSLDGEQQTFTAMDDFVYKYKNAKVWNWKKRKERTFLDKPYKLLSSTIGAVVTLSGKTLAGIMAKNKERQLRCENAINVINNLTEEELFEVYEYLASPTRMKQNYNTAPKFILSVLHDRVYNIVMRKITELNQDAIKYYNEIIELYKQAKKEIDSGIDRETVNKKYSSQIIAAYNSYNESYNMADQISNKSGIQAMADNIKARYNLLIGGVNSSSKDAPVERGHLGNIDKVLTRALNVGDGLLVAEAFLHEEHAEINYEEEKRTLKNRFGKASVGATSYEPISRVADYSENTYIGDVFKTVAIVGSICSAYTIYNLKQNLATANQTITSLNNQINTQNQVISNLQSILNSSAFDANLVSDEVSNLIKNMSETLRQSGEYIGGIAQAGANGTNLLVSQGSTYNLLDDELHEFAADTISQVDTINQTLTGSARLEELMKLVKPVLEKQIYVYQTHDADIAKYLNIVMNSNHVENWAGLAQMSNTVNNLNPSFIGNQYNAIMNLINQTNNLQAIQLAQTINTNGSMLPALMTLSSLAINAGVEEDKINNIISDIRKEAEKEEENIKETLKENVTSVEFDDEKKALKRYEAALEEWNLKSAFYKLFHRKEMPKKATFYNDEFKNKYGEYIEGGRSL